MPGPRRLPDARSAARPIAGATLVAMLAAILAWSPAAAGAPPTGAFADCAGRLTAQLEHEWLLGLPDADLTERRRAAMASLVEASVAPGDGPRITARRVEARVAHRAILGRATFGTDPADRAWAARRAERAVAACAALLLG